MSVGSLENGEVVFSLLLAEQNPKCAAPRFILILSDIPFKILYW